MKPLVNSSFCPNLSVDQVSSWLHRNFPKQSFPFYSALLPILTTCCLTRGDIFEIPSYKKSDNKNLATGMKLCAKNPSHSGDIKTSQRSLHKGLRISFGGCIISKERGLTFFWIFLIILLHFTTNYIEFKKKRIRFRNEWNLFKNFFEKQGTLHTL